MAGPSPVRDIRTGGTLRRKTHVAGAPADEFRSADVVPAGSVVSRVSNAGSPCLDVLGDGRLQSPILAALPGDLAPGQWFMVTVADVEYLVFVDADGVPHYLTDSGGAVANVALAASPTLNTLYTGTVLTHRTVQFDVAVGNPTTGVRGRYQVTLLFDQTDVTDATVPGTLVDVTGLPIPGGVQFTVTVSGTGASQTFSLLAETPSAGFTASITGRGFGL